MSMNNIPTSTTNGSPGSGNVVNTNGTASDSSSSSLTVGTSNGKSTSPLGSETSLEGSRKRSCEEDQAEDLSEEAHNSEEMKGLNKSSEEQNSNSAKRMKV